MTGIFYRRAKTPPFAVDACRGLGPRQAVTPIMGVVSLVPSAPGKHKQSAVGKRFTGVSASVFCTGSVIHAIVVVLVGTFIALSVASSAQARLFCDGEAVDGWHFYCDPEPAPEPEAAAPPQTPEPVTEDVVEEQPEKEAKPPTATEQIAAFREMAEEAKNRAILDPTVENVVAYMEINRQMAEMAGRFAAVWQRGLFQSPHLDANVNRPLTQMGTYIYQDQINAARQAALKRAASEAGLIFVFEDPQVCRVCLAQSEILDAVRKDYGIEILAVSADGSGIENFPDAVVDEGQLEALGVLDVPKPFIAILDVETGEAQLIGGGLLTEDQILERIYVIREVPLGERYE